MAILSIIIIIIFPLQYSCLENAMNRVAWWAIVHGVTKSQIRLSMHELNQLYANKN